ncbi:DUF1800 domain-containing protein [Chondrinema litorale]|uniref:DUF1800 domain-containing protein n=1 Tax=Chondrinema litorale TaxID=2994555 RepID=UPI00254335C4|nr:DUF1800 domain-containing protein [Chondrinema litorale]UZR98704.1 DUF1800 domain-containing protein [Chondrinema litorale]
MKLNQKEVQHLYWRAGFGGTYKEITKYTGKSHQDAVNDLFKKTVSFKPLKLEVPIKQGEVKMKDLSVDEKKEFQKTNRTNIRQLNFDWIQLMVNDEGVLREKMAVFWHNHFACMSGQSVFTINYLNTIRKHALGSFKEMLFAISKEPAMLQYLNNQQNRKKSPNENFAREVMELFTLGRDNYTEKDIKEAARAFTGWGFNNIGEFVFRERQHDDEPKTIFGNTGNFNGDDVLNMLLENKQTAQHITRKIYAYLVNDKLNEKQIQSLAKTFYESDYNIQTLLEEIFLSKWFYKNENIGTRIKSPIDLLVGIQKSFHIKLNDSKPAIYVQTVLGQRLLYPPNVSGWDEGKSWIDSSTIIVRTKLTQMLLLSGAIDILPKESGDDFELFKNAKKLRKINSQLDVNAFKNEFATIKNDVELMHYMLQIDTSKTMNISISKEDKGSLFRTISHYSQLMEYQMC